MKSLKVQHDARPTAPNCSAAAIPSAQKATDAAKAFYDVMRLRRSVREFSDVAGEPGNDRTHHRGGGHRAKRANKQPWRFVAVKDPAIKREIRLAAEEEEREFYQRRANDAWRSDVQSLGTDASKPFLEIAPWLIVVFKVMREETGRFGSEQVYYVNESVGIAVGLLLAAAHHAGLVTLTHTPSPMKFLTSILRRPEHERPYLLIPVGYPAKGCVVPDITRKSLHEIMVVDRPPE